MNIAIQNCVTALEAQRTRIERDGESGDALMARPVVQWFAEQMEQKLCENNHKSDWLTQHPDDLLDLLRAEVRELEREIDVDRAGILDANKVVREAADVANFAMMIADQFGLRIGSGRPMVGPIVGFRTVEKSRTACVHGVRLSVRCEACDGEAVRP